MKTKKLFLLSFKAAVPPFSNALCLAWLLRYNARVSMLLLVGNGRRWHSRPCVSDAR